MAKNYVQDGDVLNYTAAAAIASGAVVLIGTRIGIALGDIAIGAVGTLAVTGVWQIAKLSTDVVAQGADLYWDAANSRLTTTASGNTKAGFAAAASGNGVTVVSIKINA
jgi:predicted RecA/RadA family phage recombinase